MVNVPILCELSCCMRGSARSPKLTIGGAKGRLGKHAPRSDDRRQGSGEINRLALQMTRQLSLRCSPRGLCC